MCALIATGIVHIRVRKLSRFIVIAIILAIINRDVIIPIMLSPN